MSLSKLPNEIFTQIAKLLSFNDKKACMLVNSEWHSRFQASVLLFIYIKTTKQFKQFFKQLEITGNGSLVRCLTLGPRVGLIQSEFQLLPSYCPYLEYLDFSPLLWQYFRYDININQWRHLQRYPIMTRARVALPLLWNMGHHMTQLAIDAVMVDELSKTEFSILSILFHTPNLTLLQLADGISTSQNMSISEFESIHTLCPQLDTLYMDGFNGHIRTNNSYLVDIDTLATASHIKSLRLNMSINSEDFLLYWAHKYPLVENLDIQLELLEPEYYHETVQPENSRMKESFALMATRFSSLKKIKARFNEKYFPCDVFLRGLYDTPLEDISIDFVNFDYHRRDAHNFKSIMTRSIQSLTSIKISNWDRIWDYELDVLNPISECYQLETLSLSPQPGTLTEFDIDVILDVCPRLKQLELANIYNLFVRDVMNDHIGILHPLESLSLQHTMVSNRLFEYLAIRCPKLHTLDISHITKPYDNAIQAKINMPYHAFQSIRIEKLKLGLRLEDAGFQCNHYATLCSLEETSKARQEDHSENWYHLYQGRNDTKPRLQKLKNVDIEKIKSLKVTNQLWEQISFVGSRIKYEDKKRWQLDIPYGYFSVRCKSVKDFIFEGIPL